MRYDNDLLIDMLCAEYCLGTLKGSARRRFEQLTKQRANWAQALFWWESRMHLLADTVPAVVPSNKVWKNIQARLFDPKSAKNTANNNSWWKSWAFVSTALAVSMATLLIIQTPKQIIETSPAAIAILASESAKAGWLLNETKISATNVEIKAIALASLEIKPNNAFELWLLPADKSKPISLGLLPQQGSVAVKVPATVIALLATGSLAVSLEPVSGSPTGAPTGAVLYQGKMIKT